MWAGILALITLIGQVLSLINKIWDANKEKNEQIKIEKTKALQSGVRAIVDKDVSRLNTAINDFKRLQ